MPSEAWRIPAVAEWCELKTDLEEARTASLIAQRLRIEDRIGFSTAGLAEMGWKVAVDELGEKRAEAEPAKSAPAERPQRRMRAVSNGG